MEEDDPLLPWKIESSPFLLVVDQAEPALSIWVEECSHIGNPLYRHGTRHRLSGGQAQQPLNRLIGQMSAPSWIGQEALPGARPNQQWTICRLVAREANATA
jgi:hypothetical protein